LEKRHRGFVFNGTIIWILNAMRYMNPSEHSIDALKIKERKIFPENY
jgi:hypothetical protein